MILSFILLAPLPGYPFLAVRAHEFISCFSACASKVVKMYAAEQLQADGMRMFLTRGQNSAFSSTFDMQQHYRNTAVSMPTLPKFKWLKSSCDEYQVELPTYYVELAPCRSSLGGGRSGQPMVVEILSRTDNAGCFSAHYCTRVRLWSMVCGVKFDDGSTAAAQQSSSLSQQHQIDSNPLQ